MALAVPPTNDRKRVKVYELKNNDWFDRGTGFCTGHVVNDEANIHVQSEDEPTRTLLETKISKDDGYQKQQDTLIVWTEPNQVDMALSFQEADGCSAIWEFVSEVQARLASLSGPGDDGLSDDVGMDNNMPLMLASPELSNLQEVEQVIRMANSSPGGRDALTKYIVGADYVTKLVPLVEVAEEFESLADLHRLCNIMKMLILLNDTAIIEHAVSDDVVMGVVGALEYDPDFPSHKANHRQYLSDESKFKEVVRIEDLTIKKKIHHTYRLQYLKDVVLARILDDPTFSVLNSLIFFNQVEIVQHLQNNQAFLAELFGIFCAPEVEGQRRKDAVIFIQQCCAVAKNLQAQGRAQLYQNFIAAGLFNVVKFALRHHDASVRVAGTDILVALIDHDSNMMRTQILKAVSDKTKPLTDVLIELLLVEVDLGVKAQMADAIKVLLDPNANSASMETLGRSNADFLAKSRGNTPALPQTEPFIQNFYDESAKKLFQPLRDLEHRSTMDDLTIQEVSLYSHLVEVLCFFIRQHSFRSKFVIMSENLACRVAQLMSCPEKHLKLTALKYFRTGIGLHDDFHNRQIIQHHLFDPILNIVYETMPRDNLLNSACLELFEFIKRENIKGLIVHLVENYREKLESIDYVDTFQQLVLRYDQYANPNTDQPETAENSFQSTETEAAPPMMQRIVNGGRWQSLKDTDAEEEAYFNAEDDDDDEQMGAGAVKPIANGASPVRPLVSYPDDEDDGLGALDNENKPPDGDHQVSKEYLDLFPSIPNNGETLPHQQPNREQPDGVELRIPPVVPSTPPERMAEKRRRADEEDEDELGKLSSGIKRRNSTSSLASNKSDTPTTSNGPTLRRKRSINSGKDGGVRKIAITLGSNAGKKGNHVKKDEKEED